MDRPCTYGIVPAGFNVGRFHVNATTRIQSYVNQRFQQLQRMLDMWGDPCVQCYNDVEKPSLDGEEALGSVFLAGPTSRHGILEYNWRCQAVSFLRESGFKGFIYVPEPRGEEVDGDFDDREYIHHWESSRLLQCMYRVFWIPRSGDELLGLNTNLELGLILGRVMTQSPMHGPSDVFVGWPEGAERMGLPHHYLTIAHLKRFTTLHALCCAISDVQKSRLVP